MVNHYTLTEVFGQEHPGEWSGYRENGMSKVTHWTWRVEICIWEGHRHCLLISQDVSLDESISNMTQMYMYKLWQVKNTTALTDVNQ